MKGDRHINNLHNPSFSFSAANIRKYAPIAPRRPCDTNVSSKLHDSMAEIALLLRLYQLRHYPFSFNRIFHILGVKSESAANSDTMRIRNKCGLFVKIAEQKIRNLSSHSRKSEKILHVIGYFATEIVDKRTTRLFYIRCLCPVKTARTNYSLNLLNRRISKTFKCRVLGKKLSANYIDTRVRALSRKSTHNKQPPTILFFPAPFKCAQCLRI